MVKKTFFCFASLAIISSSSFAVEIENGRLLQHKEWSTGNIKVSFQPQNIQTIISKLDKNKLEMSNQSLQSNKYHVNDEGEILVAIGSELAPAKGVVNLPITVTGNQFFGVKNRSSIAQKYAYTFSICVYPSGSAPQCANYADTVELQAGGKFINHLAPVLQFTANKAGTYKTNLFISVQGDFPESTMNPNSIAESTIDVTNK